MLKTPVQSLNERCAKLGIPQAYYEFEQTQVLPCTIFQSTCFLKLNGQMYVAIGLGTKKKDAQHNAAKSMFTEKLKISYEDQVGFDALVQPSMTNKDAQEFISAALKSSFNNRDVHIDDMDYPQANIGNPIADLDEYCRRHRLPEPEYDMTANFEGPSHCPVLSVPCKIGNLTLIARSKTKKLAKRIVAMKIMTELKNRLAANGSFGGDVQTMAEPDVEMEEAEVRKHISVLDNKKPSMNCLRSKDKTYEDFLSRAKIFGRANEFAEKLINHPGPFFQQVVTFARGIDEKHPFVPNPYQFYDAWLQSLDRGIMGSFQELKQELRFEDDWSTIKGNGFDKLMVTLAVKIPGIELEPTAIKVGHDIDKLKEMAVIELVTYLGTMTVARSNLNQKKPTNGIMLAQTCYNNS